LLFNGAFEYIPNRNALDYLLNQINPILLDNASFKYKLLICGRNMPAHVASKSFPNVIIAGFVENIDEYFDATDVFVNPTKTGGGIKTKLVEAIAHNCNAVSTTKWRYWRRPGNLQRQAIGSSGQRAEGICRRYFPSVPHPS
jgi:glycosyltransferase involved in cell wall biosynthesis